MVVSTLSRCGLVEGLDARREAVGALSALGGCGPMVYRSECSEVLLAEGVLLVGSEGGIREWNITWYVTCVA